MLYDVVTSGFAACRSCVCLTGWDVAARCFGLSWKSWAFFKDVDTTRLNKIILRWCQVIDGTPFECYGAHTNVDPARLVPRCNCTNTEALRVTCHHSVGICQFYPCCYLTAACAIGHSLSLHPTARHGWRVSQFMLAAGATRKEHCWLLSAHVNLTDAQRG